MIKRDFILNETERLALIIARLMGLKADNKRDEYTHLSDQTLLNEYGIDLKSLNQLKIEEFKKLINGNYSAARLEALAQLLYMSYDSIAVSSCTQQTLQKVLVVFDLLERKYHRQSLENVNKRELIEQILKRTA
jgi:hypothetical protein